MAIELKVPPVGESITEVEIGEWLKKKGDTLQKDEAVVSLESEKATVELPSPEAGVLTQVLKRKGEVALVGEVIGILEPQKVQAEGAPKTSAAPPETQPVARAGAQSEARVLPAAKRVMDEHGLSPSDVAGTGPGGRILKADALKAAEAAAAPRETTPRSPAEQPKNPANESVAAPSAPTSVTEPPRIADRSPGGPRQEESVPMSRLRRTVAERLVQAQHTAALLTTFNEIDVSSVMELRKGFGEAFLQRYGVKLGFMSFFVKACVDALKQFPVLNAEIRDSSIIYHNYCDIGVAVGGGKGLVVPVLRNAEQMSFAEIETTIADLSKRAKENKLKLDELQGGTFTISNGGVYGSLLSTPIVNPPQSGVLGMHAIQERPVAREGSVVVRPMMYVALTYDHRIVDGREAVSFLKRVKDTIENPARMLIEI